MIEKNKELTSKIQLMNDKLHFNGFVDNNESVSIDYIPPFGDNLGYTSLELLLLSVSSCVGSAVLIFLRKMQKQIEQFEIQANGQRNQEHPTGFKNICLSIDMASPNVTDEDMKKVIALAEDKYCPVWSMIKGNVILDIKYTIRNPQLS